VALNRLLLIVFPLIVFLTPNILRAETNFIFKGQIVDTANKPVAGAEVYVFDSANIKRPADFISNRTSGDGFFMVEAPPGQYWTMAIMRISGATFGPLGKNDKHSGEPIEIDSGGKNELIKDFTVMNLQEAAWLNKKRSETVIKISGRIIDENGIPVEMAYALADDLKFADMPKYLSIWTDFNGNYELYLPKGKYFMGASRDFPVKSDYRFTKELDLVDDKEGIDLIIGTPEK